MSDEALKSDLAGRILLVASSGGHLSELFQIAKDLNPDERRWITFHQGNAPGMLNGEAVTWAHHPTNRNIPNLLRNFRLAWTDVRRAKPSAMISTGSGVAIPYAVVCRLFGIKVVFIESMARMSSHSMTARLIYPFANRFFVQWPQMTAHLKRSEFAGAAFDLSDSRN
jgi:beta-1,4-N-acetylglucosaminyltransferase